MRGPPPLPDAQVPETSRPIVRKTQYSMQGLLLAMLLFCVLAATLGGLLRNNFAPGVSSTAYFIVVAAAAPMGIMAILSVFHALLRLWDWLQRRNRK